MCPRCSKPHATPAPARAVAPPAAPSADDDDAAQAADAAAEDRTGAARGSGACVRLPPATQRRARARARWAGRIATASARDRQGSGISPAGAGWGGTWAECLLGACNAGACSGMQWASYSGELGDLLALVHLRERPNPATAAGRSASPSGSQRRHHQPNFTVERVPCTTAQSWLPWLGTGHTWCAVCSARY